MAERLFTQAKVNHFLLEYDTPRAGDFKPLRFVPKNKGVVLGLISTKTPVLESMEVLEWRIDEACSISIATAWRSARMRVCEHGRGQPAERGRSARQAAAGDRGGAKVLGLSTAHTMASGGAEQRCPESTPRASQLRFREATNNHEWILRHEPGRKPPHLIEPLFSP